MSARTLIGPLLVGAWLCVGSAALARDGEKLSGLNIRMDGPLPQTLSLPQVRPPALVTLATLALTVRTRVGITSAPVKMSQPVLAASPVLEKQETVRKRPVCQLALQAPAPAPGENLGPNQPLIGTVYSVIGNTVLLELADGRLLHVTRTWNERGYLGQLAGQRVALTDVYCSRITLAPPPPPVIPAAIEVPALEFGPRVIPVPPVTPRMPYERPANQEPQSAPAVIPQTW